MPSRHEASRYRHAGAARTRTLDLRTPTIEAGKEGLMDRDQLRALQEPLKERYREVPDLDALVTLAASGTLGAGVQTRLRAPMGPWHEPVQNRPQTRRL